MRRDGEGGTVGCDGGLAGGAVAAAFTAVDDESAVGVAVVVAVGMAEVLCPAVSVAPGVVSELDEWE